MDTIEFRALAEALLPVDEGKPKQWFYCPTKMIQDSSKEGVIVSDGHTGFIIPYDEDLRLYLETSADFAHNKHAIGVRDYLVDCLAKAPFAPQSSFEAEEMLLSKERCPAEDCLDGCVTHQCVACDGDGHTKCAHCGSDIACKECREGAAITTTPCDCSDPGGDDCFNPHCEKCHGTGKAPVKCHVCNGTGFVRRKAMLTKVGTAYFDWRRYLGAMKLPEARAACTDSDWALPKYREYPVLIFRVLVPEIYGVIASCQVSHE